MDVHFLCCPRLVVLLAGRSAIHGATTGWPMSLPTVVLNLLNASEPRESWLVNELIHEKIPRSPVVALDYPDNMRSLFVLVSLSRRHDSSVCQNGFWELEFSGKAVQYDEVPKIETGKWRRFYWTK